MQRVAKSNRWPHATMGLNATGGQKQQVITCNHELKVTGGQKQQVTTCNHGLKFNRWPNATGDHIHVMNHHVVRATEGHLSSCRPWTSQDLGKLIFDTFLFPLILPYLVSMPRMEAIISAGTPYIFSALFRSCL